VIADNLATYTPGISERRGGTTRYTHRGLKNTGAQSTSSIVASRVYDAYGMIRSATGTWAGPFGYAGGYGYQEDETGLRLLGHRYYDASTGRFLTRDPIKDGRNWYSYCDGDPINAADPTGLVLIYLVIVPVWGGFGTGHAMLVIVDNVPSSPTYGKVSVVEGARDGLSLEGSRHGPDKRTWSLIGDPLGGSVRDSIFRIILVDDQSSYSDWTRETDKVINKMKGKKGLGGYSPTRTSNTFLSEVLRRLGLLDIANSELKQPRNSWGGSRPLPGWGQPWK